MILKGIYLTEGEIEALEKEKDESGLSVSELVRRAVDQYFMTNKSERFLPKTENSN